MIIAQKTVKKTKSVIETENVNVYYGNFLALKGIYLSISQNQVTAFIGPSGCGKSTLLRCYNRLNDLIPNFRVESRISYNGQNLHAKQIDPRLYKWTLWLRATNSDKTIKTIRKLLEFS